MADPTVVSISPGQTSADNRQDSPVAQLYAPPAGPAPHDAGNGSSPSSSASSSTAASIKKLTRSNTLSDHGTAAIDKKYEAKRAAVDSWYHRRCDRIEQNYQDEDSEKRQAEQQKLEARHAAKLERAAIKYNKRLSKAEEKARKQSYKQINSRKSSYTAGKTIVRPLCLYCADALAQAQTWMISPDAKASKTESEIPMLLPLPQQLATDLRLLAAESPPPCPPYTQVLVEVWELLTAPVGLVVAVVVVMAAQVLPVAAAAMAAVVVVVE